MMAFGEFYVQRECWAKWPKVLWMVRKQGDGNERRRYLPERTGTMDRDEYGYWVCSECGETLPAWVDKYPAKYCPYCGAKVVER